MDERILFLVLVCLVLYFRQIKHSSAVQCPDVASTVGREFLFGVIGTPGYYNQRHLYIHVTSTTDTAVRVRITSPFNNFDQHYTVYSKTIIPMNDTHMQRESGSHFKGIEIYSDGNISVAVFAGYGDYTEGFLALPTAALSTRYVAASYHPYSVYNNEILVAGIESNTDILINLTTKGHNNISSKVNLQKFETYLLAVNYDVSGAVITSNKPVAVTSGSSLAKIPVDQGDYEYIVEQMIPTKYWSRKFIVSPIYPHNFFIVRVFADQDGTEIIFYNSTNHFAEYMNRGSHIEILFGSDPTVIISNKPISVVQYCLDNERMSGDPFMTTVQGLGQFVDSYKFVTQQYASAGNTLAITIKKTNVSGLVLNGTLISSWSSKSVTVPHPMNDYVAIFVNISYNSLFDLHHRDGMLFGATVYGFISSAVAYGYPLQMLFSNAECAENFMTTTTTTSSTSMSINTESTTSRQHTNGGQQGNEIGNGTWCFKCEDMAHLQFCDTVTRCNPNEVCYIQKYTRSHNFHLFRSGCIQSNKCQNREDQVDCQQCCHGNFCNVIGCGDDGLPNFDSRGPFCFDCAHQGQDDFCQSVHMCRPDQVCKIEKYEWGSGYHYVMGCADNQVCSSKRDIQSVQARYAPVCSKCCRSDFCNMNCTTTHAQQIIG